jgi:hypothetical protein
MSKITIYAIYLVLVLSVLLCVGSFIMNFHSLPISRNSESWGQLGDYIGGLMNPIISIINVLVAIRIANAVNTFTEQQTKKQLDAQKEMVRTQLLYEVLKDFKKDILTSYNGMEKALKSNDHVLFDLSLSSAHTVIDSFIKYHQEMFSFPAGIAMSIVKEYNKRIAYRNLGHFGIEELNQFALKNKIEIDLMLSLLYGSIIEAAKKPEPKPITKEIMDEWETKLGLK